MLILLHTTHNGFVLILSELLTYNGGYSDSVWMRVCNLSCETPTPILRLIFLAQKMHPLKRIFLKIYAHLSEFLGVHVINTQPKFLSILENWAHV